ncbi:MAG: CvpA family protein [bacterium]|nr:CvpA family protein [bacterium]
MNLLDVVVMVVLLYNAFIGFRRGLIRMFFDLVALVGGVFVALQFYQAGDLSLQEFVGMRPPYSTFFSFILIWGVFWGCFSVVGNFMHRATRIAIIWPVNVIGGGFLGGVRGFFYLLPFLVPLSHTDLAVYHDSQMAKPLNSIVSSKVLTPEKTEQVLRRLNAKASEQKASMVKKDPTLKKVQSALESGDTTQIKNLLDNVGQ